jgi:hypothetical protein
VAEFQRRRETEPRVGAGETLAKGTAGTTPGQGPEKAAALDGMEQELELEQAA